MMKAYLIKYGMAGQIDPWRKTYEGLPIYALLVPVETALDEYNYWSNQGLTRSEFLTELKKEDILVFKNIDEFVRVKETNQRIEKQLKLDTIKAKKELTPERKEELKQQMIKINTLKRAPFPKTLDKLS